MITVDGVKIEAVSVDDEIVLIIADVIVGKYPIATAEAIAAVIVAAIQRSRSQDA